ncbi:uncharacterized protein LOC114939139 [Nylanderia fulva]|uniref:uncharacterized protein LOC114939139 n=1 Tax=Nylanderia fulva TaxID=613905 RepID=UPI0010FADF34|nr:uncharacterized protein LOC114939139 [Nylanderia fulva]
MTSVNKKGEMLKEEKRNVPCEAPYDLAKKLYPPEFRNLPILSLLKHEFIMKIRMVMVYGDCGNKPLIVKKDKIVHALDFNGKYYKYFNSGDTHISFYPKIILYRYEFSFITI